MLHPQVSPSDKATRIRAMFSAITPRYDLLNHLLSGGLDQGWRRRVVAMSGVTAGSQALDVCTGTGDLAGLLARVAGPTGYVAAVDFCETMLARARAKHPAPGFPQLEFLMGDALHLPFPDCRFDAATMAFGLRNLADPLRGFQELCRVIRPGGTVLVLELTRPRGFLRLIYQPYLFFFLPLVGRLISGDRGAYRYLARSIAAFLSPSQVIQQMTDAGLKDCRAISLCGGIATIFHGTK